MLEIDTKREAALELLNNGAASNLTEAAELVGVKDSTLCDWCRMSPEFKRRWDAAMARAKARTYDRVESVMVQRAIDPKNPTGVTAGIFLLKSHRAHTYADKPQALSINVSIDKAQINLATESTEQMRQLEAENSEEIPE